MARLRRARVAPTTVARLVEEGRLLRIARAYRDADADLTEHCVALKRSAHEAGDDDKGFTLPTAGIAVSTPAESGAEIVEKYHSASAKKSQTALPP